MEHDAYGLERQFSDAGGVRWTVREIVPLDGIEIPRVGLARPEYRAGWLLFSSAGEKRRLAPYPLSWRRLTDTELAMLCQRAHRVALDARSQLPRSW